MLCCVFEELVAGDPVQLLELADVHPVVPWYLDLMLQAVIALSAFVPERGYVVLDRLDCFYEHGFCVVAFGE